MGRRGVYGLAAAAALATAAAAWGQGTGCGPANGCGPAPWAVPSDTGRYIGYCVGGGSPFHGEPPAPYEGVWGWDYSGVCFMPRIALWWNHGRRYQGGPGAYRPDGPRPVQEHKERKGE